MRPTTRKRGATFITKEHAERLIATDQRKTWRHIHKELRRYDFLGRFTRTKIRRRYGKTLKEMLDEIDPIK